GKRREKGEYTGKRLQRHVEKEFFGPWWADEYLGTASTVKAARSYATVKRRRVQACRGLVQLKEARKRTATARRPKETVRWSRT
ncbi:hypothetical protein Q9189_007590, partial [Teloschistes chrysophthalmus]